MQAAQPESELHKQFQVSSVEISHLPWILAAGRDDTDWALGLDGR